MNVRHTRLLAITLISLLAARSLQGAVVERDLHTAGDGLLTYDTVSGREWLDVSATPPVSYAQIQSALATNEVRSLFGGFRIAQFEEVYALVESAGISPDAMGQWPARPANSSEIEAVFHLAELVCGTSCNNSTGILAQGGVGLPLLFQSSSVTITAWTAHSPLSTSPGARVYGESSLSSVEGPEWFLEILRNRPVGSLWLYRAAVPEPAMVGLLLPLLLSWPWLRRRGIVS